MKKILLASLISALFAPASFAADEPASPHTISYNAGVASEYMYRGIAQTNHEPALQLGADYSHSSGFYVSTWGSNVRWHPDFNPGMSSKRLELDLWGGYKKEINKDLSYDVGVFQYYYPGSMSKGVVNPNTTELYVSGTYKWVSVKYWHSVTNLLATANSKGSGYLEANVTYEVAEGTNLVGHLGYQRVAHNSAGSYTDYSIGATKEWQGVKWGLAFVGTNADKTFYTPSTGKYLGAKRAVFTAVKTF